MGGQGGILAAILKLYLKDTTILVTLTLLIRPSSLYRVVFQQYSYYYFLGAGYNSSSAVVHFVSFS